MVDVKKKVNLQWLMWVFDVGGCLKKKKKWKKEEEEEGEFAIDNLEVLQFLLQKIDFGIFKKKKKEETMSDFR